MLFLVCLCAPPLSAQKARWKKLNTEVTELYKQGKFEQGIPVAQEALKVGESTFGPTNVNVATSLNNLAEFYVAQGRYGEAEPLLVRALGIREKALGPEHPYVATSLNNLAELYRQQGRYGEATPLEKRALGIWEKARGPRHPDVATSLSNLANLYWDQNRYGEAEPLYKRALAIQEKTLGPDNPAVATSLNDLANLYWEQRRYGEAEPLYKRALAIYEKALGPDHPYVATSLNNQAALYELQGRYGEAEPLYERALGIREKALGPDHPDVAWSLHNLAGLYHAAGVPVKAAELYDRSLTITARLFDYYFTYMSEKERLEFVGAYASQFPDYFSFCLSYREQLPELVGKMYDVVLWEKGFIAQSVAALRARIRASGDSEAFRLLEQLTQKKSLLAKLVTGPPESEPQNQAARRAQIEQLEKESNDIEKELVNRSGTLAEAKRLEQVSWRDVQKILKEDEAAVEIVRFPFHVGKQPTGISYYVALVLTPETTAGPKFVVLGEAGKLESELIADYRRFVSPEGTAEPSSPSDKSSFFDAFWKPLEPVLGNSTRIYWSPDGLLNQVSLGIAPDAKGRLLLESHDLHVVSSTKDILRQKRSATDNSAVLVGNPLFDLDEKRHREAKTQMEKAVRSEAGTGVAGNALRSRELRGGMLTPLPGTKAEIEALKALLEKQKWQVEVDTGEDALKERLMQVRGPRVLHLATHGFFLPEQSQNLRDPMLSQTASEAASGTEDPMLRSGLFLAGANRTLAGRAPAPDLDDGILTAYEATELNLQGTELVVLSACDTGLGQTQAGEGVFGLRRALQEAGAESVLMSMWSVPDQETRELMELFYTHWLDGEEKHAALRHAELEEREVVQKRYGRDLPYYWGAFVLVGR